MSATALPRVALTTSFEPAGGSHGRAQIVLYANYVAALEEVGLAPVLLTPAHGKASITALLDACDGLVLSGGGDIDPARYGETPSATLDSVSAERDEAEFTALTIALERELPVFGICRGIQVLNVQLGGTLHQDLDTERAANHPQSPSWSSRAHDVDVIDDTRLREIVGAARISVNSFHHQAVRQVAPRLRVSACAEDGVIEAVEMDDYPWCLGVQWHPERRAADSGPADPDRRLFEAFARAVARRRARPRAHAL